MHFTSKMSFCIKNVIFHQKCGSLKMIKNVIFLVNVIFCQKYFLPSLLWDFLQIFYRWLMSSWVGQSIQVMRCTLRRLADIMATLPRNDECADDGVFFVLWLLLLFWKIHYSCMSLFPETKHDNSRVVEKFE